MKEGMGQNTREKKGVMLQQCDNVLGAVLGFFLLTFQCISFFLHL